MASTERSAHGLLPLSLAVILMQEKILRADPNALAARIAAAIPLYEYADDPRVPPHIVTEDASKGLFRNGGRELHFSDGTPAKRRLAVQADELAAVIGKLTQTPLEASSR